jgi:hypothetical protein
VPNRRSRECNPDILHYGESYLIRRAFCMHWYSGFYATDPPCRLPAPTNKPIFTRIRPCRCLTYILNISCPSIQSNSMQDRSYFSNSRLYASSTSYTASMVIVGCDIAGVFAGARSIDYNNINIIQIFSIGRHYHFIEKRWVRSIHDTEDRCYASGPIFGCISCGTCGCITN